MKKNIKIGILWADPANSNLGVGALALSSLALLNDVAKNNNLNVEFSFVCSSKFEVKNIVLSDSVITYSTFPGLNYMSFKAIAQLILLSKRFQTKKILGFDYVFDISAGDSFADIYGDKRFNLFLNTKRFFSLLRKKQILLPQTIGPFKNKVYEKRAFSVMKTMELVISRDRQSYEYTQKYLPKNKILESIDVAFYLPFQKQKFDNKKINVGINISALLWNGGYTKNNQFGMKTDYKKLVLETLNYFYGKSDVQIHLIPHVIPENVPVEDDYTVSEEILIDFPNIILAPRFAGPIEAKSYISGLDFFTGGRMHACIGAFSSGVPVFPMAYSRKFNGLFIDTLQYKYVGDCVNEPTDLVLDSLKKSFENRSTLKSRVEHSLKTIAHPRLEYIKSLFSKILN